MRSSEEILTSVWTKNAIVPNQETLDAIYNAVNEARKECLVEAAKKCKGGSMMGEDEIAYKILSLIDEIK